MALVLPRSVFFHIPKTEGEWVRKAILNAGIPTVELGCNPSYPSAVDLHNTHTNSNVAPKIHGKFTFTFVRHPLNWYPSFWAFRMFSGWGVADILDPCMSVDFNDFMRRVLRRFPGGHLYDRYQRYVGPEPSVLDFVGKTENLVFDLIRSLKLAGEEFDEQAILSTPPNNESPLLPTYLPRIREAVLLAESRTLERFGYGSEVEIAVGSTR